jgi:hypothetical protein
MSFRIIDGKPTWFRTLTLGGEVTKDQLAQVSEFLEGQLRTLIFMDVAGVSLKGVHPSYNNLYKELLKRANHNRSVPNSQGGGLIRRTTIHVPQNVMTPTLDDTWKNPLKIYTDYGITFKTTYYSLSSSGDITQYVTKVHPEAFVVQNKGVIPYKSQMLSAYGQPVILEAEVAELLKSDNFLPFVLERSYMKEPLPLLRLKQA